MRLRTRIALAAGAAVLAAVTLFAFGAYHLISERARDRLDSSLRDTAARVTRELTGADPGAPRAVAPVPDTGPLAPVGDDADDAATRIEVEPAGGPAPGGPRTITRDGERFRLLVTALPAGGDGVRRSLVVARPLTDVEETLDEVALGLAVAATLTALLATGLTFAISRGALRPLTAARRAAEVVADSEDPSLRVPEGRADEVGGLARAINRMLVRLEAAQTRLRATVAEQRRFAADASHEIRTPLTALRGEIETLQAHDPPPAERAAALSDMARSVDRMDHLVAGLLGLARVDGGDAEPERVDLGEIVGDIAAEDECVRLAPGAVVTGDRAALRGMLVNLVDNGRRHGGAVSVEVAVEGAEAVVRVCDDGAGIAEADRERVFDRFYRAPDRRGSPGAGLGLPIARATAEHWGGSLRALPSRRGALLEVRLPRA